MSNTHLFPVCEVIWQLAIARVHAVGGVEAKPAYKVLMGADEVLVLPECLVGVRDFPKVPNRGDGPNAEAVHVTVEEHGFHCAVYSGWRSEIARRGCDPVAHPARLTMRTCREDSQRGSSGGSPAVRAGRDSSRNCRVSFPLNTTGQRQPKSRCVSGPAPDFITPDKRDHRGAGGRQRWNGATSLYLPPSTIPQSSYSRQGT